MLSALGLDGRQRWMTTSLRKRSAPLSCARRCFAVGTAWHVALVLRDVRRWPYGVNGGSFTFNWLQIFFCAPRYLTKVSDFGRAACRSL